MTESYKSKVVDQIISLLHSEDDVVRCSAAQALGGLKDIKAVDALIGHLKDQDEDVAHDAICALGTLAQSQAIAPLLESYNHDPSGSNKVAVVEALGKIGGEDVIQPLISIVQSRGEDIYWELDGDWDDWWDAQYQAIEALGRLGVSAAAVEIEKAIDDEENQDLTDVGFKALAKLGEPGIKLLLDRIESGTALHKRRAINALMVNPLPLAWPVLGAALRDPEYLVRIRAAKVLVKVKAEEYLPQILQSLQDPFPQVRKEVATLLQTWPSDATKSALTPLLEDPDPSVCRAAVESISTLG
ncbi:MAG: hypothetical protein COB67_04815, partial [SAR324 cluster bacterium]